MQYQADILWERNNKEFNAKSYDRTHQVNFAGGLQINASAAPEFLGNAALPNPEELFTAALASCFMLTFLYLAANKGLKIDSYQSKAVGKLNKNSEGKMAMTEVEIIPSLNFTDNTQPDKALLDELYKKAHEMCFISSSVKTNVVVKA